MLVDTFLPDRRTPGARPAGPRPRRPESLLLLRSLGRGVPLLEPGDAAACVEDLLLAGVERVAGRADVDAHGLAARAPRGERVAAGAGDLGLPVGGVDVGLHVGLLVSGPGRQTGVNRHRGSIWPYALYNAKEPDLTPPAASPVRAEAAGEPTI